MPFHDEFATVRKDKKDDNFKGQINSILKMICYWELGFKDKQLPYKILWYFINDQRPRHNIIHIYKNVLWD